MIRRRTVLWLLAGVVVMQTAVVCLLAANSVWIPLIGIPPSGTVAAFAIGRYYDHHHPPKP